MQVLPLGRDGLIPHGAPVALIRYIVRGFVHSTAVRRQRITDARSRQI